MELLQAAAMLSHANTCTGEIADDVVAHSVNEPAEIVECRYLRISM